MAAVDRYLEHGYLEVYGMSSRFAGAISAWLLAHQVSRGIRGDVVEIGTFEGRYFIALALALEAGEHALGMDTFNWPNDKIEEHLVANAAAAGLARERYTSWRALSTDVSAAELRARLGDQPVRFFHIDGDHSPLPLRHDLDLALATIHPDGLVCLDDMLHPGYPFLVATVRDWLVEHPDWRLMAIIDREDIVGAAKFLLCRQEAVQHYERALMDRYPQRHYVLGGDALGHHCVVLTPSPRIARVD